MEPNRKQWNADQKTLRALLARPEDHDKAVALFLKQHAMVHTAEMAQVGLWSFADEIWQDASEDIIRRIPQNRNVSIAWHMWHLARIEDITMNLLVAGRPQLFQRGDWAVQIQSTVIDTGNAMDRDAVAAQSAAMDIDALRAYRMAVGRETREIVQQLTLEQVQLKVDPVRLQQVKDEGAVVEDAYGIVEYWGRRTIAGLLLMPPTRHNLIHINKALRLKALRR